MLATVLYSNMAKGDADGWHERSGGNWTGQRMSREGGPIQASPRIGVGLPYRSSSSRWRVRRWLAHRHGVHHAEAGIDGSLALQERTGNSEQPVGDAPQCPPIGKAHFA